MKALIIGPKPRNPLNPIQYCMGKYAWTGKASFYHGITVMGPTKGITHAWIERRTDKNGPYAVIMCSVETEVSK